MKKLIALMSLSFLAACGGSDGSSGNSSIKKYEETLMSIDRGLVIVESHEGRQHLFTMDSDTGRYTDVVEDVKEEVTEIVLKVENGVIYKYVETKNFLGFGEDIRSVRMESFKIEDFQNLLRMPGAKVENDIFKLITDIPVEWDLESGKFSGITNVQMTVDLKNPHCSMNRKNVEKKAELTQAGIITQLEKLSTLTNRGCLPTLSPEQLRGINLTSIQFCDDTGDAPCKEDQDMSYLTDDL